VTQARLVERIGKRLRDDENGDGAFNDDRAEQTTELTFPSEAIHSALRALADG